MDGGSGPKPPRDKTIDRPWAVIASVLGLILAGIAYSLGDAYYTSYLGGFAVYNGAFPADHPTHFVLAVWGALHATVALQNWLDRHVRILLLTAIACLIYFTAVPIVFLVFSKLLGNGKNQVQGARSWLRRYPSLRRYLGIVAYIGFVIFFALWCFLFVPPMISFPSAIGEVVGRDVAQTDLNDFNKGCAHSSARCYQALENGKEIAHGYIIAQSPTRVAIYYAGNTTQFSLDGVILRTLDPTTAPTSAKP